MAVRYFIEYFRQYLIGRHFKVRTDHQALVWLFKLKEPKGKIARWIEILSHYDFEVEYRPGHKQSHCDALSRCVDPRSCSCPDFNTLEPLKCLPCKKCKKRAQDMLLDEKYLCYLIPDEQCSQEKIMEIRPAKNTARSLIENHQTAQPGTSRDNSHIKPDTKLLWDPKHPGEQLKESQCKDPDIYSILKAKQESCKPTSHEMLMRSPAARHYWILWDNLEVKDGVLFKRFAKGDQTGEFSQLVVPYQMKSQILKQAHDSLLGGHMGCKKTLGKLRQLCYWYNMKNNVALYVRQCEICAADKRPLKTPKAPLGNLNSGAPWDVLATDYMGPFPETPRKNKYILVLTDHFTKYVEVLAVPDQTAETCASKILNEFISRWGCPLTIHSDQGRNYESKIF
jgi:hypothetical protein